MVLALAPAAQAATLTSSTYTSYGLSSAQDIDVTGSTVVDWGYYNLNAQKVVPGTTFDNSKAVSGKVCFGVTQDVVFRRQVNRDIDDGAGIAAVDQPQGGG